MVGLKRHNYSAVLTLLVTIWLPSRVSARGRMMEPPQRSSLFARGFNSPVNDDDSALDCGGAWRQHELNGGRCGVCGDPYDALVRENEAGGKFANGIIANTYTTNDSSIPVVIDIQSFLKGFFEFRICPHNDIGIAVTQECLDKFPLHVWDMADSTPQNRYYPKGVGLQRLRVELPKDMTCSQCVLQWTWRTGTNWGRCKDGLYRLGCGPQETYINCADVAIVPANDKEYKHFSPQLPNIPGAADIPNGSNGKISDSAPLPWDSVSFVSHDSKTVVDLRNTSDVSETSDVSNYNTDLIGSFLPKEAIEVIPDEAVQPKFDIYDPTKSSTVINDVKTPETQTESISMFDLSKQTTTVDASSSFKPKKEVVVLPYNGATSETIADSTVADLATKPNVMDNTDSGYLVATLEGKQGDLATESIMVNDMVSTGMSTTYGFDNTAGPNPTVPSIAASSTERLTTKGATTRNFDIRTFTGINSTTPNLDVSTKHSSISSDINIHGKDVEAATQALNDLSADLNYQTTETFVDVKGTTENPIKMLLETGSENKTLSRHPRQAGPRGPPPPPPPEGPVGADPSPSAYDPSRSAGTLAQKEVIIQQQFSSANEISRPSSLSTGMGPELTGVEALGEQVSPLGPQAGPIGQPMQVMDFGPQLDPRTVPMPGGPEPGPGPMADPSADSGVPYTPPRIPRPPEVSAAEIEAAIADTPIISSAVSDTGKPMDASSILGTKYIPGLNEAASNLAETSTASRQGTMIVHAELTSPADRGKKTGDSVEYLSPTKGTSASDKPSETQAQIPITQYSSSLGFMPTPEQIMSGMRGITRPIPADTTNLEPVGPDPSIQNIQEAKEALIQQLGQAMGIIPGEQQAVPDATQIQTANAVPDPNTASALLMAGGQTSAGPLAMSAESMAANMIQPLQAGQMDQPMVTTGGQFDQGPQSMFSDASQTQTAVESASEQTMFSQAGFQTDATASTSGTEAIPGLMGRLAGQMGNISPEVMQLIAKAHAAGIDPRMILASMRQSSGQLSIAPGTVIQGDVGAQMEMQATGPDMMISEITRQSFGPDMMMPESEVPANQPGQFDLRNPVGPDMIIPDAEVPPSVPKMLVGPDSMPQPQRETIITEPAVPHNAFGEKATDITASGANMLMDQAMMQNIMRMRLSPEMINFIKFGKKATDKAGTGELGVIDKLIKRNAGMMPNAPNANVDGSQATEASMSDLSLSSETTQTGQSEMNQAMLVNQAQLNTGLRGQQSMAEELHTSMASKQPTTTSPTTPAAKNQQQELLMNMRRLFGNVGAIGGGLMGGAKQTDMSGVQYETPKKVTGQADMLANQVGEAQTGPLTVSQAKSTSGTSGVDQPSDMSATFSQESMFSGLRGQLMSQFGLSGASQGEGQSAVVSEVVSDTSGITTGQEFGQADGQVSDQVQATSDFTPIGQIGTFSSLTDSRASSPNIQQQQWSWDPKTQAWVLVSVPESQTMTSNSAVTSQIQMQTTDTTMDSQVQPQAQADVSASQGIEALSAVENQPVGVDLTAAGQQAADVSGSQGQVGQTTFVGYQWNAASNSYVPVLVTDEQLGLSASATSSGIETLSAVETPASQFIASAGSQQTENQMQAQATTGTTSQAVSDSTAQSDIMMQEQGSVDAVIPTTGQVEQTWEQTGFKWDAATNAYVPVGQLEQTVAGTSQVAGIPEVASSVDQSPAQSLMAESSTADLSATGNMQGSGSVQMSAVGEQLPAADLTPESGIRTTEFRPSTQLQAGESVQTGQIDLTQEIGQADMSQQLDITQLNRQTDASGTQTSSDQVAPQQQGQQALQQAFQQVDFTQWVQQQQGLPSAEVLMQHQGHSTGLQDSQQADAVKRASAFDMSAQQALSAEERSKSFQQSQQGQQSSAGPLMVEEQPWEQQGGTSQVMQQQQGSQTGTAASQVTQLSQQMDATVAGQATQQQWSQGSVQGVSDQMMQHISQQAGATTAFQAPAQQQPGPDPAQMMQYNQQHWQAAQNMNQQAPQFLIAQQGQTSAGPIDAVSANQLQQTDANAQQATSMQTWNQNMQAQAQAGQNMQVQAQAGQNMQAQAQAENQGTQMDSSFTPIGEIGSGLDATAQAWQALIVAAQAEAQSSSGPEAQSQPAQATKPIVSGQQTTQQTTAQQPAAQTQQTVSWEEIVKAAMAHQNTQQQQQQAPPSQQTKPKVPAWATGLQSQRASESQPVQQQQTEQRQPPSTRPEPEPERKIPIRPDPVTRAYVRDMFVKQMSQGPDVNPLHILIGLNPEMLMKAGVNPRIARSGDVSQIVPAVERALGISLRRRRGRGGGSPPGIGGSFADPMGGPGSSMDMGGMGPEPMRGRGRRPPSARDRALQRRKFMMEQRMITEMMGLLGLGPEPLEPGDPGYRGPGQRGGSSAGSMGGMGPDPMMDPTGAGMDPTGGMGHHTMGGGMSGMSGGAGVNNPQMRMMSELLGF